ncbi:hypothetical protein [Natrarchaeobius oligotrophus]|nr:hypothetical protein [Natrarchaeobius chitinivorans]
MTSTRPPSSFEAAGVTNEKPPRTSVGFERAERLDERNALEVTRR